MANLIDGKRISQEIKEELKIKVAQLKEQGIEGCLAVIQVGADPASSVYVRNKKRACAYIGIESRSYELSDETTEQELLSLIGKLNEDPAVNGILVQLPVPPQIDENKIIQAIDPAKDVDGFHPQNVGALVSGLPGYVSCTPAGVIQAHQHCRNTDVPFDAPGKRDGYDRAFQNKKPARCLQAGGYFNCGSRKAKDDRRVLSKGRCRCH